MNEVTYGNDVLYIRGGQMSCDGGRNHPPQLPILENLLFNKGILEEVQNGHVSWELPGKKLAGNLTGINGK